MKRRKSKKQQALSAVSAQRGLGEGGDFGYFCSDLIHIADVLKDEAHPVRRLRRNNVAAHRALYLCSLAVHTYSVPLSVCCVVRCARLLYIPTVCHCRYAV
jgi:hypothetical protein